MEHPSWKRSVCCIGLLFACLLLPGCASGKGPSADVSLPGDVIEEEALPEDVLPEETLPEAFACTAVPDPFETASGDAEGVLERTYTYDLGEEQAFSYVRLVWSGTDFLHYTLSGSADGQEWTEIEDRQAPLGSEEHYTVPGTKARFLKLSVSGEAKPAVFSLYGTDPWEEVLSGVRAVLTEEDGSLFVSAEGLPAGIEAEFLGCSLPAVIGADGKAGPVLEEKDVTVGFRLLAGDFSAETKDLPLTVAPAEAPEASGNEKPPVLPVLQEWRGGEGNVRLSSGMELTYDETFAASAAALREDLRSCFGVELSMKDTGEGAEEPAPLRITKSADPLLGEEGYTITLDSGIELSACTDTGIFWGTRTLLQLVSLYGEDLPCGMIRDYPEREVRGVEIDVARNFVNPKVLEKLLFALSWYKGSELTLHLNDNEILAYSGKTGSREEALTAFGAYRLPSSVIDTGTEAVYTPEDIEGLQAQAYRNHVRLIPEIDAPAHCLAFTKVRPDLALPGAPDGVDELNLAEEESFALVSSLWREQLEGSFAASEAIHLGADEYYGGADYYLYFVNRLLADLSPFGKEMRLWGSLSRLRGMGRLSAVPTLLLWSREWADAREMYDAGYSLINADSSKLYLIPGGGVARLDHEAFYESFFVNRYEDGEGNEVVLPAYSRRLLGSQLTLWNDLCGSLDRGISDSDIALCLLDALPLASSVFWNGERETPLQGIDESAEAVGRLPKAFVLGHLPETEEGLYFDFSEEPVVLDGTRPVCMLSDLTEDEALGVSLRDGIFAGPSWRVEVRLVKEEDGILFFGTQAGERSSVSTGGSEEAAGITFCGEDRTFSTGVSLPDGEEITLALEGSEGKVLAAAGNGESVSLGSPEPFEDHAGFSFPLQQLGAQKGGFRGKILSIRIQTSAETSPGEEDS